MMRPKNTIVQTSPPIRKLNNFISQGHTIRASLEFINMEPNIILNSSGNGALNTNPTLALTGLNYREHYGSGIKASLNSHKIFYAFSN